MFTKTMAFDDLDGNEVTETFYFNFTKKEIAELVEFGAIQEFADPNKTYMGLDEMMKRLTTPTDVSGLSEQENTKQAYNIFQDLLLDAYGVKGADNRSFDKSPELRHYWSRHLAYDALIWEFIGDTALASLFIEKCLPPRLVKEAKNEMQKQNPTLSSESLTEMVEEANRRQQDPATRVEPGTYPENESPEVLKLAESIKENESKPKPAEDLTPEDIELMDDIAFKKLDPRNLTPDAMLAAFRRKSQS